MRAREHRRRLWPQQQRQAPQWPAQARWWTWAWWRPCWRLRCRALPARHGEFLTHLQYVLAGLFQQIVLVDWSMRRCWEDEGLFHELNLHSWCGEPVEGLCSAVGLCAGPRTGRTRGARWRPPTAWRSARRGASAGVPRATARGALEMTAAAAAAAAMASAGTAGTALGGAAGAPTACGSGRRCACAASCRRAPRSAHRAVLSKRWVNKQASLFRVDRLRWRCGS